MGEESMRAISLTDKGGHFYRADFQVHTPRDTQWDGARPALAEREQWAAAFVAAARERGLDAVAISDHHDFAYFPYIRKAAAEEVREDGTTVPEAERLVVFPALELTLSVPCQAIMILDADFPEDRLDDVLKALHFDPIDAALDSVPQVTELVDSGDLNALHEKLDSRDWLRGRYIVLPNVTPSGYKTLLRTSFQSKYRDMRSVGGYLDGTISVFDSKVGDKKILDGKVPEWGSKRLALFQTSDSRTADFSNLGKHSTWVKWAAPTAEALRQACLAQDSRVSQSEPSLPNAWISRVVVSQSKFMGRVDVALNPQYTALIGGRGTGKSTILDYLRWALCDQPASSTAEDEVADPRVRQRRLIEVTLKALKAHVEVHCVINGITHVVRRHADDGTVQLKVGDGDFEKVREGAIQSLLPIQAYSQKQLSSVAIRIDELLRFVTSPIQRDLEEIERRQHEVAGRLRENYGSLQRHRDLSTEIERSELRVRSLGEQAQALRDGLSGISEADRLVLDGKAAHDRARTAESAWTQQLGTAHSDLTELVTRLETSLGDMTKPDTIPADISTEVDASFEASVAALSALKDKVAVLAEEFAVLMADGGAVAVPRADLAAKLDAYEQTYAAVKARSSAHEAKLGELASLEQQQKTASELAQRQRKERDTLGKPDEKHRELRKELTAARRERSEALAAQCDGLSACSDGMIRATLSVSRGFDAALAKFKALVTGSNVRTNKIERFFEELAKESDPAATWELVLEELESLMLLEPDADVKSEHTPTLSRLEFVVADQKKIIPKLTPDGWLDLSLTELADFPEFEYRAKENEYIPFDSASAGQQASALLATLLSQGGTPLIIDQPEDDLDSDTVQEIVAKIWESKSGRQLIFSSHNANLVVNGDADLVLVCAYVNAGDQSAGHIKEQGAIDVAAVRDQITAVMEGGEKAFRLRKEKYGF
ncbi:AAA family ATPase [Nocardioides sp. LMS-CY]|uniref:TrlF family AAA-like ATPase n=1 Tax=Nocardioides sp. (strain LMS-CY) TaxID=2840457 RepID=UPI001C006ABD|nr:AAA family ATPase [Nocardioides sp. LMS-CY]QWF22245.1 AAA family ATPase [Nocardioides sp. LMS-CY]